METDKKKLYHKIRGSRVLADKTAEAVAYLLCSGIEEAAMLRHVGITDEQYNQIIANDDYKARLAYLSNKSNREKKRPKTPDECLDYVKKTLWKISKSAADDKAKIDACKALAGVAIDERKNRPAGPGVQADGALDELSKLRGDAK
jgi:hypothetical protein